jgi:hypothetical protein
MRVLALVVVCLTLTLAAGCSGDEEMPNETEKRPPPAGAGAPGPAEVVVYWTPTGMGPVEMNLDRWARSMGKGRADAKVETAEINGLKVTTLDVSGTYRSSMGGAHGASLADARLRCAVVEVPEGAPYYIRALGPSKTMAAVEKDFATFLSSLRMEEGKLVWDMPEGWRRSAPQGEMRYAQIEIPAPRP